MVIAVGAERYPWLAELLPRVLFFVADVLECGCSPGGLSGRETYPEWLQGLLE